MSGFLHESLLHLCLQGHLRNSQSYASKCRMDYSSYLILRENYMRNVRARGRIRCLSRHWCSKDLGLELSDSTCGKPSGVVSRLWYHKRDYWLVLHGWWLPKGLLVPLLWMILIPVTMMIITTFSALLGLLFFSSTVLPKGSLLDAFFNVLHEISVLLGCMLMISMVFTPFYFGCGCLERLGVEVGFQDIPYVKTQFLFAFYWEEYDDEKVLYSLLVISWINHCFWPSLIMTLAFFTFFLSNFMLSLSHVGVFCSNEGSKNLQHILWRFWGIMS